MTIITDDDRQPNKDAALMRLLRLVHREEWDMEFRLSTWTSMILHPFCTRSVDKVVENFVLVAENVVVDIEHLRRLPSEDERLHETTHRTHVVGQLARHLRSKHQYSGNAQTKQHTHKITLTQCQTAANEFLKEKMLN